LLVIFFVCTRQLLFPQLNENANTDVNNRKKTLLIANSGFYVANYVAIYQLWYKNYELTDFHFFDDSKEWLQMDKFGHVYSAYYLTKYQTQAYHWSGMNSNTAILTGSIASIIYISSMEFFDGLSANWGASVSDIGANVIGIGIYVAQQKLFNDEYIIPKYSYNAKSNLNLRPELLGRNDIERIIKDYNGQNYWFSFNIKDLSKIHFVPDYLNLALGYGAKNMLSGKEDLTRFPKHFRKRQYYLALDINLNKIKTKKPWLNKFFGYLNMIKVPLPTIEYCDKQFKFYPVYF